MIRCFSLALILLMSGCAAYKFQRGKPPYEEGYVVSREDRVILEYTVGKDNSVPDLGLAKERFKRRKGAVEDYYKKMGRIENRFKENVGDRLGAFAQLIGAVFATPARLAAERRYENDPEYRARIDEMEAKLEAIEGARKKKLKEELDNYIQQDLTWEESQGRRAGNQ